MASIFEALLGIVFGLALAVVSGHAQRRYSWCMYLTNFGVFFTTCAAIVLTLNIPFLPDIFTATTSDGLRAMFVTGIVRLLVFVGLFLAFRHLVYHAVRMTRVSGWRRDSESGTQTEDNDSLSVNDRATELPPEDDSEKTGISIGNWRLDIGHGTGPDEDTDQ